MEYLFKEIKTGAMTNILSENLRFKWFLEFFDAVSHIHANKIVHRDLTPSNILLYMNKMKRHVSLKIGDFGLSKQLLEVNLKSYCGTFHYISPEILNRRDYSFKTDVWYV